VANSFVFVPSHKYWPVDLLDATTFVAPIVMVGGAMVLDGYDLVNKGLVDWHLARYCVTAGISVIVCVLWWGCYRMDNTTRCVLRVWHRWVMEREIKVEGR